MCSESRCALRLRYVDLVVSIEVATEVCVFSLYSVVKQRLKCNTSKARNLIFECDFLLGFCFLNHEFH
jgi:hypothetical protein